MAENIRHVEKQWPFVQDLLKKKKGKINQFSTCSACEVAMHAKPSQHSLTYCWGGNTGSPHLTLSVASPTLSQSTYFIIFTIG